MDGQWQSSADGDSIQVALGESASTVAAGKDIVQINYIPPRLPSVEERKRLAWHFDWVTYVLIGLFGLFCIATVVGPFLLFEYSSRALGVGDVQNWILTLASIMSGLTGLLGVLVGYRIRDLGWS